MYEESITENKGVMDSLKWVGVRGTLVYFVCWAIKEKDTMADPNFNSRNCMKRMLFVICNKCKY